MKKFLFIVLMFGVGAILAASTPVDLAIGRSLEPESMQEIEFEAEQQVRLESPVPGKDWGPQTKVWLARSCVGEAGFFNIEECIAIAWVYATRANDAGWPLIEMMKKYSAALKRHKRHRRPWIFQLNANGRKPESWPAGVLWSRYRGSWMEMLETLDRWQAGEIANPVPGANHFGSPEDEHASVMVRGWNKLETPEYYENLFFDSSGKGEERNELIRQYVQYMRNKRAGK